MSVEILSRAVVEENEEMLLIDVPVLEVNPKLTASFYCGIDCGSTQTRSTCMPKYMAEDTSVDIDTWFQRYLIMPSVSKAVTLTSVLRSRSNLLYDNLDSIFSINGEDVIRLIRGSKFNDVELAQKELFCCIWWIRNWPVKRGVAALVLSGKTRRNDNSLFRRSS